MAQNAAPPSPIKIADGTLDPACAGNEPPGVIVGAMRCAQDVLWQDAVFPLRSAVFSKQIGYA